MFDKYENIYNDICQICSKEKNSNKISDEAKELYKTLTTGIDFSKGILPVCAEQLLWQVFNAGYEQGKSET